MSKLDELLIIKNDYSSVDRVSFSVDIITCSQEYDLNCHDNDKIKNFMEMTYFTFYVLEDVIDLNNRDLIMSLPTRVANNFVSQFSLKPGKYLD